MAVEEWVEMQLGAAEELKWQLQEEEERREEPDMPDLIFFLHIPRAGGKSYHQWYVLAPAKAPSGLLLSALYGVG